MVIGTSNTKGMQKIMLIAQDAENLPGFLIFNRTKPAHILHACINDRMHALHKTGTNEIKGTLSYTPIQ
jgi:hypothetical protein